MRILAAILAFAVLAAPARAGDLSAADKADLDRVSAYLNSIRSLKGSFVQINPDGTPDQGKVWLVKPGRIRFEYDPPAPMLVVSDGKTVAVQNKQLKTVDRYPISQTPLGILLGDNLDLKRDRDIVAVERQKDALVVRAHSSNFGVTADIALMFADPQLELRQWTVIDNQGLATTVALRDTQTGVDVPAQEFVLPRPSILGFH